MKKAPPWKPAHIKTQLVATSLQQFGVMLKSGLPIDQAIDVLASEGGESPPLAEVYGRISQQLRGGGCQLSTLFRQYPSVFDSTTVLLLQAGENSGQVGPRLEQAAQLLERRARLQARVSQALVSPAITAAVSAVLMFLIVKIVIPKFLVLYSDMAVQLPWISQVVIDLVAFLNHPIFLVLVLTAIALAYYQRAVLKQRVFEVAIRLPGTGPLLGCLLGFQFCDVLASLSQSGVPLNRILRLIAANAEYSLYQQRLNLAVQCLEHDGDFPAALRAVHFFPGVIDGMVAVAGDSGKLYELMQSAANILEQQAEFTLETVVSLIEPLVVATLGVVLSFFFVGMVLPIYQILNNLGT